MKISFRRIQAGRWEIVVDGSVVAVVGSLAAAWEMAKAWRVGT